MRSDTDRVIEEAEVYAAYGRFSEAISILELAVSRTPSSALRIKLSEIRQRAKTPLTMPTQADGSTRPPRDIRPLTRVDFGALRSQAEALPDAEDRAKTLAALTELERSDGELERLLVELEPKRLQQRRERWFGLFVLLPIVVAAIILFISKLATGQIPNIFVVTMPDISWDSDPYQFVFVVVFIGMVLFALTCAAIGLTRFGGSRSTTLSSKRSAPQPKR